MQSTMIMSALANTALAEQANNLVENNTPEDGSMPTTAMDMLDNVIANKSVPEFYTKPHVPQVKREYKKIGRNDPCACGSGKKYKNCCMNSGKYEGYVEV